MDQIRHFSHSQISQIFASQTDLMANGYISHNLAVAREIPVSYIKQYIANSPVMMQEMRVLIMTKGSADIIINMRVRHIQAGDLVFLYEGSIVQYKGMQDGTRGMGMSISRDLFVLAFGNRVPAAFDGHLRDFKLSLAADDIGFLDSVHKLLYANLKSDDSSPQVTLGLVASFMWHVDHLWGKDEEVILRGQSREQRIFSDFLQLVSAYATQQHNIDFYADRLFLSPRYMGTLIKKVSGRSAKDWIDDAIVTRIKVELKYSDKQVCQISDEMCFPNTSFFSKYFKRLTGMTPLQYRVS